MKNVLIRSIKLLSLIIFLFFAGNISAQYSPVEVSDSTKTSILKDSHINFQKVYVSDLSVNRKDMAIFCKWELDIEDFTTTPVKFRLGTQEIVDRLENKGPTSVNKD